MKIKLTICYDGTNYCGWQMQKNGISIQQTLLDAIYSLTNQRVKLTGSGRTDAGVHAKGQVADFEVQNSTIPPENFAKALNTILPSDIKVMESSLASEDFCAITSAKEKTYRYSIYFGQVENPLLNRYAHRVATTLNFENMRKVCSMLRGSHDFKCFMASGSSAKTTTRTIYSASICLTENGFDILVVGNGFLYNMVRIIAGLLVAVGQGKVSLESAQSMIDCDGRPKEVKTLPANGLCLESVKYQGN